ncbi:hypothetical protein SY83_01495 [Paenibacillus swuensis]|uniref:SLH domain-containing protein n=1 Tax=Paenibacillus swuensis TaxID=1178515 RepID=A0A172TE43_9BACL|nr:Ig-like domain-containing protein [Paenibacillus swuensis]ANE45222.1 hypothetical protein SY83_01495 [Paenibacillus swuensis]
MRKVMSFGLVLLLMLSAVTPVAFAADLTVDQKYEVLVNKGIFAGFSDGSSRLNESMTREQFAAVLFRLLELSSNQSTASKYNDVLKTRWSFDEIAAVSAAGLMKGVSNGRFEPLTKVSAEQLATVLVRTYGISGSSSTKVNGYVSKWAASSVAIALDRKWFSPRANYTDNATRGLLVEAAYTVYEDTHKVPMSVKSVVPLKNNIILITFNTAVKSADKSRFVLKDDRGNGVFIQQATLSADGLTVVLLTNKQNYNQTYSLYIDGSERKYKALSDDSGKPQVTSVVNLPKRTVEITFQEPVDAGTATTEGNYTIDNGVRVLSANVSSDKRKVTLGTTEQQDGKTYKLTIRRIKDLSGNVMDDKVVSFIGNQDGNRPKVTSAKLNPDATLTLVFSEKVNPDQARNPGFYSLNNGLSIQRLALQDDGKTVIITTSQQKDATLYKLTVKDIVDLGGNHMETLSEWSFGGISNPQKAVQLQSIGTMNKNTIEVYFNRALSDSEVSALRIQSVKDNGGQVSLQDWKTFVQRKSGTDHAVTVQFRTGDANPNLLRVGHVYEVSVSNIPGLVTSDGANRKSFAGTEVENHTPYVKQVTPVNRNSVKVIFSEPVKNISKALFNLRLQGGAELEIESDGVNNTGKIVTEVTLQLKTPLEAGKKYTLSNDSGITDAAGWNGLRTKNGDDTIYIVFDGVS